MFTWSRRRQIIYIFLFLSLVALIVASFYLAYKPVASCFDKKQNQSEEGVDCGGPCSVLCVNKVFPVQVAWTRILPVRAGQYDFLALLVNNNNNAGLQRLQYNIKYFNERNFPIKEENGMTTVAPGEKFAIFRGGLSSDKQIFATAALTITGQSPWVKTIKPLPTLSLVPGDFNNASESSLSAKVTNGTLSDIRNIYFTAVLFDKTGNVIGASATFLDLLGKSSTANLYFTWPQAFAQVPAQIEIYPHLDTVGL